MSVKPGVDCPDETWCAESAGHVLPEPTSVVKTDPATQECDMGFFFTGDTLVDDLDMGFPGPEPVGDAEVSEGWLTQPESVETVSTSKNSESGGEVNVSQRARAQLDKASQVMQNIPGNTTVQENDDDDTEEMSDAEVILEKRAAGQVAAYHLTNTVFADVTNIKQGKRKGTKNKKSTSAVNSKKKASPAKKKQPIAKKASPPKKKKSPAAKKISSPPAASNQEGPATVQVPEKVVQKKLCTSYVCKCHKTTSINLAEMPQISYYREFAADDSYFGGLKCGGTCGFKMMELLDKNRTKILYCLPGYNEWDISGRMWCTGCGYFLCGLCQVDLMDKQKGSTRRSTRA